MFQIGKDVPKNKSVSVPTVSATRLGSQPVCQIFVNGVACRMATSPHLQGFARLAEFTRFSCGACCSLNYMFTGMPAIRGQGCFQETRSFPTRCGCKQVGGSPTRRMCCHGLSVMVLCKLGVAGFTSCGQNSVQFQIVDALFVFLGLGSTVFLGAFAMALTNQPGSALSCRLLPWRSCLSV